MSSVDWVPELAAALEGLVPLDDGSRADWADVVGRVGGARRPVRRWQRPRGLRLALVVALLLLLLTGVATATYYLALRASGRGVGFLRTKDSALAVLDAKGRPHEFWRCPRGRYCGFLDGAAWSPDGRRLALAFEVVGSMSTYPLGLHIIDLNTGADRQIPAVRVHSNVATIRTAGPLVRAASRTLGCVFPDYLSWSPDGSRLAYTCEADLRRALIYTIRADGTGRRLLPTHTRNAYAPSWSPDGKRIAFSTCRVPVVRRNSKFGESPCRSAVYVVDLDGRHERWLAAGSFPDWSPDGKTLAYATPGCGRTASSWRIRLVTPRGRDVTPATQGCGGIGPPGSVVDSWSPDGRRIAIATQEALYVMRADGVGLDRLERGNFLSRLGGLLRPLWQPEPGGAHQ